jgi:hypothetical protein
MKERSLLSAKTQHTATTASCVQSFALPPAFKALRYLTVFLIPSCGVHREPGQQASGTPSLAILYGREAIRFLGSALCDY